MPIIKVLKKFRFILCFVLFLGTKTLAYAQNLPGSADPSRFDQHFELVIPGPEEDIEEAKDYSVNTPIPKAKDGFVLEGITLSGLKAFPETTFLPLIMEYVGRSVDIHVLNHLAARITAHYRENGYFLSKAIVPAQEVNRRVVQLQIIESYVHDVIIDDPNGALDRDLLGITDKAIARIKNLDPLHGPTLERYILLLNEGAGVSVQSIMASHSDTNDPGGIVITLKIAEKPSRILVRYNNHGSKFVGPHQVDLSYVMHGFFTPYDTLTLQSTTSIPLKEVNYGAASYSMPLNANGLRFNMSASYANSEPGDSLNILEVESDTFSWEGGITYPIIRSRRTNFNIGASLQIRNTATEFLDQELIDDKVRSFILRGDYNTQHDDGSLSSAIISLHKGFDIFAATKTGEDNLSRAQGRSDFVKLEAALTRVQLLPHDLKMIGQIEGQYAPHPLLSSGEFGYGGIDIGRAYDASEITGDQGLAGSLELRYSGLKPIEDIIAITPFAFYDIGKVWNYDRGSKPLSAASAGLGAYYQIYPHINGSLLLASPLTKSVATPVMGGPDGPRILFELNVQF